VQDTGIPDLQKWCHQLTIASRERAARTFFAHLKTFAQSIHTYVNGIGEITAVDRESLREKWESRGLNEPTRYGADEDDPLAAILGGLGGGLGAGLLTMNKPATKMDPDGLSGVTHRLCTVSSAFITQMLSLIIIAQQEFAKLVDQCVQDLQQDFKDGLEEKCRVGAENVSYSFIPVPLPEVLSIGFRCRAFDPRRIHKLNALGYLSSQYVTRLPLFTPRTNGRCLSALRRHGAFRRDLNVELINPFTRNIAHSWSRVFESDLFGPFKKATIDTINELVKDVEESAAHGLKDRARLQGETCVEEARVALEKTVDLVKETMNQQQKEVSRCLAPHVQEQLIEGYDTAMEERGTGSVARQKVRYLSFVGLIRVI